MLLELSKNIKSRKYRVLTISEYREKENYQEIKNRDNIVLSLKNTDDSYKLFNIKTEDTFDLEKYDYQSRKKLEFLNELKYPFRNMDFIVRNSGRLEDIANYNYVKEEWNKKKVNLMLNYDPVEYIKKIVLEVEELICKKNDLKDFVFQNDILSVLFLPIYGKNLEEGFSIKMSQLFILDGSLEIKVKVALKEKNLVKNEVTLELNGEIDDVYTNEYEIKRKIKARLGIKKEHELAGLIRGIFVYEIDTGLLKRAKMIRRGTYGDEYLNGVRYEVDYYE